MKNQNAIIPIDKTKMSIHKKALDLIVKQNVKGRPLERRPEIVQNCCDIELAVAAQPLPFPWHCLAESEIELHKETNFALITR